MRSGWAAGEGPAAGRPGWGGAGGLFSRGTCPTASGAAFAPTANKNFEVPGSKSSCSILGDKLV